MLSTMFNSLHISCDLTPVSGFLIKADTRGANFMEPHLPDNRALRTVQKDGSSTVFIPGSSIKGVVRSASERILRSLHPSKAQWLAEDPLNMKNRSHFDASKRADAIAKQNVGGPYPMAEVYKMQCLASRTFGSQAIASRVRCTDAFPSAETQALANQPSERSGVAIDRKTGGPGRGKLFQSEVVTNGNYEVEIFAENVQLWQIGLLGLVLEDIDFGLVRLGSSKTRGLGTFRVQLKNIRYTQMGSDAIQGVAGLAGDDFSQAYDLTPNDAIASTPKGATYKKRAGRHVWNWSNEDDCWGMFHAMQEQPWNGLLSWIEQKS